MSMRVVGYTDRLSVQPGESIRFMVSCEAPSYEADVVRLIHGDEDQAGPGFKAEPVQTPIEGRYPGRRQRIDSGSYVIVPDQPALRLTGSFTLQAWIYPTLPRKGVQGLLTKWCAVTGAGYGLFIDEDGALAVWIGDGEGGVERHSTGASLRESQWYFVAGAYDAEARRVSLYQEPSGIWPDDESRGSIEAGAQIAAPAVNDAPLLMAAYWNDSRTGKARVSGHYNGKIDGPCVFDGALTADEVRSLRRDRKPSILEEAVARWDFARDFTSATVTDVSPNGLHGTAINMPGRAVTGHNFSGNEINFNHAPNEYAALYFHDDDLEDARWEVDFELEVPDTMRSGVYASRLRVDEGEGGEDYVPFFVRPRRGTSSAPILFLAPTASYLAYANAHFFENPQARERVSMVMGRKIPYPVQVQDRYIVENRLLSLYDRHADGSGVFYSSALRPIASLRPKYDWPRTVFVDGADAHPHQFTADLFLVDWMEEKGYQFDVATDGDLHLEGEELLARYPVVVTGSHPEYWSAQMLDALESYLSNGGRLMYLGGNGFYWVTSFDPMRPHVIEVRRWHATGAYEADPGEYYHSTTGELGGLWRFRNRAPQRVTGVGFTAQGPSESQPYRRGRDSFDPRAAFIFEGIEDDEPIGDAGLIMGGAAGHELDRADTALGTPPHALVVATARGFSDGYQHCVEEVLASDSRQGGTVNPLVRADMVYFETREGGAVFSVGSIAWCGSLSHNGYDNAVSRITGNVLKRFSSEEPIPNPASDG